MILEAHGHSRSDPFFWLRDADDPKVEILLRAENEYLESECSGLAPLTKQILREYCSRILETDCSAPAKDGPWYYHTRTEQGLQFGTLCRRRAGQSGPEGEDGIVLDENRLSSGHEYFEIGAVAISPDHSLVAYTVDTTGKESFDLHVRHIASGTELSDHISGLAPDIEWSEDSRSIFIVVVDALLRPWQVKRHILGMAPEDDSLVLQENDSRFHLSLDTTTDRCWITVTATSMNATEIILLRRDQPELPPRLVAARREGIEYSLDHHEGSLLIVTNDHAPNFRLMRADVANSRFEEWVEVVGGRDDVRLYGVDAFAHHMVLYERSRGVAQQVLWRLSDDSKRVISQKEPLGVVWASTNLEYETSRFRYGVETLTNPSVLYEHDLVTDERLLVKATPILGAWSPEHYESQRLWAPTADGELVPISIVYPVDMKRDGRGACLLTGYGAYEASIDPDFSHFRLSLLERGCAVAIAHVRGGGELGRRWYEGGRLSEKANSVKDFIACAEHLISLGWTSPQRLVIRGGSAGGLLVAAAVNMRPDLFRAVVAEVPFVDVLTTMLDEELPLTCIEHEEWGDPGRDSRAYNWISAYSPYDNVIEQPYPYMLVTAALHDPRVGYWEAAKWVQRLRYSTTSGKSIVLKVDVGSGHLGRSGRYEAWEEEAFILAWILVQVDLSSVSVEDQSDGDPERSALEQGRSI